jgi:HPt (histidine-containing phosphotransfer) domain-containing protein
MLRILAYASDRSEFARLLDRLQERGHVVTRADANGAGRSPRHDLVLVDAALEPAIGAEVGSSLRRTRRPIVALGDPTDAPRRPSWVPKRAAWIEWEPGAGAERIAELIERGAGPAGGARAVETGGEASDGETAEGAGGPPPYDLESSLARLLGSRQLFDDLARMYCEDAPVLLREVVAASAAGDAARVRRGAHSLAGTSATFDGHAAVAAAVAVEAAAERGELEAARALIPALGTEVARLEAALRRELGGVG